MVRRLHRTLVTFCAALMPLIVAAPPAQAATNWSVISAGSTHSCAIRAGTLYCWGSDADEKLGNGPDGEQDVPQKITAATDWKSVSVGTSHTCAIRAIGKLYCWGDDSMGQLGNGPDGDRSTPQLITAATDWTSVSAGNFHNCAIRAAGKLYCWGFDGDGRVGNGPATPGMPVPTPQLITAATDWKSADAGALNTCAIRATGKLYCWGFDFYGVVGNGSASSSSVAAPLLITGATDWRNVSIGAYHACATRIGKLYCWGDDSDGALGNGPGVTNKTEPAQVTTATDWLVSGAGLLDTCAIRAEGKLYCWGGDGNGQLGNGADGSQNYPQKITLATDWSRVSTGAIHTCAIRAAGKLYCWGSDGNGRLGNGPAATDTKQTPQQI